MPHYPRQAGAQSGGSPRVVLRALGETIQLWWRLRDDRPAGATGRARWWSPRGGAKGRQVSEVDGAGGRRRRSPRGALALLLVLGGVVGQRPGGSQTQERPR